MNFTIKETHEVKLLESEEYNYAFNKWQTTILRWGKTKSDNPYYAPYGPEIAYIDVDGMSMELFTVVLSVLTLTKSLALVMLIGVNSGEQYIAIQDICEKAEVTFGNVANQEDNEDEGALFSLYVDNNGVIKPSMNSDIEGISALNVNNLMTDVWMSEPFKRARWSKLQGTV